MSCVLAQTMLAIYYLGDREVEETLEPETREGVDKLDDDTDKLDDDTDDESLGCVSIFI